MNDYVLPLFVRQLLVHAHYFTYTLYVACNIWMCALLLIPHPNVYPELNTHIVPSAQARDETRLTHRLPAVGAGRWRAHYSHTKLHACLKSFIHRLTRWEWVQCGVRCVVRVCVYCGNVNVVVVVAVAHVVVYRRRRRWRWRQIVFIHYIGKRL